MPTAPWVQLTLNFGSILASISAHAVDDRLDDEYIEQMEQMATIKDNSNLDLREQDLLLENQIEDWENEEDNEEEEESYDAYSISQVNKPWDYFRPEGETDEDELDDEEDQNMIKIDSVKGKSIMTSLAWIV